MMETRRITIHIAGRIYPLNVTANEEENLRKVGKQIENMIKEFEKKFDIQDKQDALAMCALQLGAAAETKATEKENIIQSSMAKLKHISQKIDNTENI